MRAPGEILLVSCYELGHQPLSLASPLAHLEQAGYRPRAIDSSVQEVPDDALRRARLVAVSVPMHTALRLGVGIAERVRAVNPGAHICMFGLYAGLNAGHLLERHCDSVLSGEVEGALVALAGAIESNRPLPAAAGTRERPGQPVLEKLQFAVPQRRGLPGLGRYARLEEADGTRLAGYVEASRGCLHTCLHCPITPIYHGRFFVVPADVVLADIRQQVRRGARHITFGDPDFLNGPGHAMKILRRMHAEFPDVTFDATIKIEHILERRELFAEMRELGCAFVLSAVESLSDRVLAELDKGHRRDDVLEALAILEAAGIPLRMSLVAFTPWTALEDYLEVIELVQRRGLIGNIDPVQFSIRLLIPPGSALLDRHAGASWLGELDPAEFTYRWTHPDPRMDRLQRSVAALVEDAAAAGEPAAATFARIRRLAYTTADLTAPPGEPVEAPRAVPRLTESWFC